MALPLLRFRPVEAGEEPAGELFSSHTLDSWKKIGSRIKKQAETHAVNFGLGLTSEEVVGENEPGDSDLCATDGQSCGLSVRVAIKHSSHGDRQIIRKKTKRR